MNSQEISQFLGIIATEPGKNAKIELLEEFLEDEDFERVIQMTYDPLITYGVLQVPEVETHGNEQFNEDTFKMLHSLSQRKLTCNSALEAITDELLRLDMDSGEKSVNKASPNTIRTVPYMRCSTETEVNMKEKFHWLKGVYSQVKADGLFANVSVYDDYSIITSRKPRLSPP